MPVSIVIGGQFRFPLRRQGKGSLGNSEALESSGCRSARWGSLVPCISRMMSDRINELARENEKLRRKNIEISKRILHLEHLVNQ